MSARVAGSLRYVTAACLLLVLAGCTSTDIEVSSGYPSVVAGGDPNSGMEALVGGRLEYRDDVGCFVIVDLPGGASESSFELVVWPPGTIGVVRDGVPGVDVPDFGEVLAGQYFLGGGGHLTPTGGVLALPDGCYAEGTEYALLDVVTEVSEEPLIN